MRGSRKKKICSVCARRKKQEWFKKAEEKARAALSGKSIEESGDATDTQRLNWLQSQVHFSWTDGPGNVRRAIDSAMKEAQSTI